MNTRLRLKSSSKSSTHPLNISHSVSSTSSGTASPGNTTVFSGSSQKFSVAELSKVSPQSTHTVYSIPSTVHKAGTETVWGTWIWSGSFYSFNNYVRNTFTISGALCDSSMQYSCHFELGKGFAYFIIWQLVSWYV